MGTDSYNINNFKYKNMKKTIDTLNRMIRNKELNITDYDSVVFGKRTILLRTYRKLNDLKLKKEVLDYKNSNMKSIEYVWFYTDNVRVQITFLQEGISAGSR